MNAFTFPSPVVIRVQGKHARRYLQNRLSNDVTQLAPGQHCIAGALSAQGKIEAYGICIAEAETSFIFYSTGGDAQAIREALARFRVAEQVDFALLNASLHHTVEKTVSGPDLYAIILPRIAETGTDLLGLNTQTTRGQSISVSEFYRARWEQNHALFPDEIGTDMLHSEIGQSNAISFTKGCYVGQEVIAKIDSLGRPPRLLRRVKSKEPLSLENGAKIENVNGRPIGEIRSALSEKDRWYGFVLIKNDANLQECFSGGKRLFLVEERKQLTNAIQQP